MDQFSGIRAKRRRKRGEAARTTGGRVATLLLAALLALPMPAALASGGGHDTPAAAPAAPPPPPPPPPPEPRRPPPDVRPPIDGPIAATAPKPRVRFLADPASGVALGGYDPVVYFLGGRPGRGSPQWQLDWGGATWHFRDEGDLAAFKATPEVYAPLFAGRCAFAVSRGWPAEGSPLHTLVWRGRLLLFADATSRIAFLEDPDRLLAEAERRWPGLAEDLQ